MKKSLLIKVELICEFLSNCFKPTEVQTGKIYITYKKFSNFFLIMLPKVSYSPGPHESIAPNSAAKF